MRTFLTSVVIDIVLIFISYFIFRAVISGPTRHRIYEKYLSSFAKFIIYVFLITVIITGGSALILYRTRLVTYLDIIAPALVSILVGFVISLVPTRGAGDKEKGR